MVAKTQTGNQVYLLAVPSIITSSGASDITLLSNTFLFHGQTNSGGIIYPTNTPKFLIYSSGALPSTDAEKLLFASGIANAYSGSILATNSNIQPFINALGNTGMLTNLGGGLLSASLGGVTSAHEKPPVTLFSAT